MRITNHLDDGVIAKRLTSVHWAVCASPSYLAHHGTPATPAELTEHQCYHYPSVIKQGRWSFTRGDAVHNVPVRARLHVNSSQIIADHTLAGRGIALLPTYLVGEHLQAHFKGGVQPTIGRIADKSKNISCYYYLVTLHNSTGDTSQTHRHWSKTRIITIRRIKPSIR